MNFLTRTVRRAGWKEFVLLIVLAGLCVSTWAFVEITDTVIEGELHAKEELFMKSLRSAENPGVPVGPTWLLAVAEQITALGGMTILTIMVLLVIGYLLLEKKHHTVLLFLSATLGGGALSFGLKYLFSRERPSLDLHLVEVSTHSYPSGHSMLSSIVYLTLGALLARTVPNRRVKIYFILVSLLLSFLVGLSRIYLGVHYPTDVLAGWSAGTAWALLCWLIAFWLQRRGKVESSDMPSST